MGARQRKKRIADLTLGLHAAPRVRIDMQQHVLGRREQRAVGLAPEPMEQVQPLFVGGDHLRLDRERVAATAFVEMTEMRLDRVEAPMARQIGGIDPDPRQHRVGRLAEALQVAVFGHVAVVVDPLGRHLAPPGREQRGTRVGRLPLGQGPRMRRDDRARAVVLLTQRREHRHETIVALAFELADRDTARLVVGLRRDAIDQVGGEFRRLEMRPGKLQGRPELRQEVAHAGLAAREPIDQERAHEAPAQARSVADRVVDLLGRGDAVVDEPERLAPQRFEQAIGDEAVDLLADAQHPHADAPVERGGPILRCGGGLLAAADLDQRQQVDRVERMADDEPRRIAHAGREPRRQQARRRGRDHDAGPRGAIDVAEHPDLQRLDLGEALDDEVGLADGIGDGGGDAEAPFGNRDPRHQLRLGAARVADHRLELAGEIRVGIVDGAVVAVQQEAGGPARPDDAAADEADRVAGHAGLPRLSSSRTAAGPMTAEPIAVRIVEARSTSAPLVASSPRSSQRLSSRPTRTLPPASAAIAT